MRPKVQKDSTQVITTWQANHKTGIVECLSTTAGESNIYDMGFLFD